MGNDNSCMKTYHLRSKTNLHAVCKCENNGIKCIDTMSTITQAHIELIYQESAELSKFIKSV